jgi:hypothetical protein
LTGAGLGSAGAGGGGTGWGLDITRVANAALNQGELGCRAFCISMSRDCGNTRAGPRSSREAGQALEAASTARWSRLSKPPLGAPSRQSVSVAVRTSGRWRSSGPVSYAICDVLFLLRLSENRRYPFSRKKACSFDFRRSRESLGRADCQTHDENGKYQFHGTPPKDAPAFRPPHQS